MSDTVQQIIVTAAIAGAILYLVRSMRKKPGCGGGCGPDCSAKDLQKPAPDDRPKSSP